MRVLLVEPEISSAQEIASRLRKCAGYAVDQVDDHETGFFMAKSEPYDAVLLALDPCHQPCLDLLKRLRKSKPHTPLVILADGAAKPVIAAILDAGADDFLRKPVHLEELFARTRALIRRSKGHASPFVTVADVEVDTIERRVKQAGRDVVLNKMEYSVLEYLAYRSPAAISETELRDHLYEYDWGGRSNVIEVYVGRLRRKLKESSLAIRRINGFGYVLQAKTEPTIMSEAPSVTVIQFSQTSSGTDPCPPP